MHSFFFFLMIRRPPRSTLFPTRRSSDLGRIRDEGCAAPGIEQHASVDELVGKEACIVVRELCPKLYRARREIDLDRKSTRLNSSHGYISYAVFCLKKKK